MEIATRYELINSANLQDILFLLVAAVLIVTTFKRLSLSPVLGYLVAGGIIGPHGLRYIQDVETTRYIAEFGVVFLLFTIGLELTFARLKSMRMHVFGFGTAQMIFSGFIIGGIAYYSGADADSAVVIGGGLALSSTAIVLQVLQERGEQATQVGRISLAALILQDLAVVPLLIMVPLLAREHTNISIIVLDSISKAAIVLGMIFLLGKRLLRPLFRLITSLKSQELFIATTLLIILGSSYFTKEAGLSLALGAFMAGLLVAETEYRPQVEADMKPFKGLLMGLFFMTIGMSIDFIMLIDRINFIIISAFLIIAWKAVIVASLCRLFGFRTGNAIHAGLLLSQGSEFAFVLFSMSYELGLLDHDLAQILLVIISLTMAVTPILASFGQWLAEKIDGNKAIDLKNPDLESESYDLDNHIIVAGFGRVGKTVCKLLMSENITNYIAIDSDSKSVNRGRKRGYPVYYGDADRIDILRSLGIERARLVAITIRDKDDAKNAVAIIHKFYPDIPIIARAFDRKHAKEMRKAGAMIAMSEAFESSLMLGGEILKTTGTSPDSVEGILDKFRSDEYPLSVVKDVLRASPESKKTPQKYDT